MIGKKVRYGYSIGATDIKVGATLTGVIYDKILINGTDHYLIKNQQSDKLEVIRCKDIEEIINKSRKV